jgi:uncharacterized membrane protein YjjP (DUF1212 family)
MTPQKSDAPKGPVPRARRPWKKKTPMEVVLEQADRLRQQITNGEAELKEARRQLQKLEDVRKVFEA